MEQGTRRYAPVRKKDTMWYLMRIGIFSKIRLDKWPMRKRK